MRNEELGIEEGIGDQGSGNREIRNEE